MTELRTPVGVEHIEYLTAALAGIGPAVATATRWGRELADLLPRGGRLFAAGNGGSAAQAAHLTAELVGRYRSDRRPFSAVALHAEVSALTAITNDYGHEEGFARQLEAHARPGDGAVPVVQTTGGQVRAGGAGLTAALAARDGGRVVLVAPLAEDDDGARLRAALPDEVEVLAVPWSGSTPVKHRIRASGQTVARVDRGGAPGAIGPLPDDVAAVLHQADAVVVADYGYGTTADPALRT